MCVCVCVCVCLHIQWIPFIRLPDIKRYLM